MEPLGGSIHTIMIIEDEDDILNIYKDFLQRKGFRVAVSAPTANEVLTDYKTYTPDLTMIDYQLPGAMNGLEAAEKILRFDESAKIMIVTASETIETDIRNNAFLAGKKISVIRKPIRLAVLAKMISNLETVVTS